VLHASPDVARPSSSVGVCFIPIYYLVIFLLLIGMVVIGRLSISSGALKKPLRLILDFIPW